MRSVIFAVATALAGTAVAQQPPADYLKRVADAYRAAFAAASGAAKGYITRADCAAQTGDTQQNGAPACPSGDR